jgi:peptide/nickel transport system substrate-binding protein
MSRFFHRHVVPLGIAALCLAATVATAPSPAAARDIAVGLAAPPTSFDPHYHAHAPSYALHRHVFEPLVLRNPDLSLAPLRARE